MKVKEESEKVYFKLNIQKTKIMPSSSITLWQIDGKTLADFIFLGSKVTADGDCSHVIKRCLLFGFGIHQRESAIKKKKRRKKEKEKNKTLTLWKKKLWQT